MNMDRRLTNGLAWAGALLVIGIPAADYLTRALDTGATPSVAVIEPEAPATTSPAAQPVAPRIEKTATPAVTAPKPAAPAPVEQKSASAVDDFVQSGRALPSYITGGDKPAAAAATPARPVIETPAATASVRPTIVTPVAAPPVAPEQVAALPARVAPVPMPLSMRPAPVTVPLAPSGNAPLIIDQANAPIVRPQVLPPQVVQPGDYVSAEDLADWESGPLSDFLARRQQQSSATYVVRPNEPVYEPEGIWLDEVLRPGRPSQRFDNDEDVYFVPF
jgi:hypothetical protein